MTATMIWICHAATAALRRGVFPKDEPIDPRGAEQCAVLASRLRRPDRAWCAPELRARETAAGLGLEAAIVPDLRDCDYGSWAGRDLRDIEAEDPETLIRWIADPMAAPHGGESFAALLARVAAWIERQEGENGYGLAVASAPVIRAAVLHAIGADIGCYGRIDIGPLSQAVISRSGRAWRLQALTRYPQDWIGPE